MKTTMFRRLAIITAAAAPIALSTSLASAAGGVFTQSNHRMDYTWSSSNTKSATISGRAFKIGYTAAAKAHLIKAPGNANDAYANGQLDVPVTFFGKSGSLFAAGATAQVIVPVVAGGQSSINGKYNVNVLGSIVKSGSLPKGYSGTLATYTKTLLTAQATVSVYGFPVTFTADATGTLSLKGSFGWASGKFSMGLTPGANVDAGGSAAVGGTWHGVGLEGGVEGSLAVLDASIPLTASITPLTPATTMTATGSLALSGMSGNFGVFTKACAGFFGCYEKHLSVFSWSGASYTVPAFNVTKTITFS